ncbi:aldolase/citrate lyase family protein [Bosea sp. (in: a-proteobacteria)]|uniref:HpcH/HpaI aldolase family protein n=1 Tax=Bosea sp. (in: a-proteobacteria) TaxID=1871050 RepID=UPI002605F93C|nr:aldolase/citrate lyase family protein [Bosea sp. (in: a-proteobacteria)]MCO5091693.1 aldolase/citrate lyase family protein [Bosea sp. (in: a-proteobacteria)]
MFNHNSLKQAIADNRRIKGVHFTYPALAAMEILAAGGIDYIYIDGEHGAFTISDIEAACIAAERHGVTPIARVPDGTAPVITQFLDRGVRGIVVPHVETVEQARIAVEATYYAPLGQRSFGGGRPYAHIGNRDLPSLLAMANEGVSLSVMIETGKGLENIAAIAAVPGVDYLSYGMMDLCQSLGHPGEPRHPRVTAAVEKASAAARAAGKPVREDFIAFAWINDLVVEGARQLLP